MKSLTKKEEEIMGFFRENKYSLRELFPDWVSGICCLLYGG